MLIVSIRTDNPDAEIGIFNDSDRVAYVTWPAHRELAETIHLRLRDMLKGEGKDWTDIQGVVFYKGPGSFTGLRIGASVANALAEGFQTPIVGSDGDSWIGSGITRLMAGEHDPVALPEYGAPPHITAPKK